MSVSDWMIYYVISVVYHVHARKGLKDRSRSSKDLNTL